MQTGKFRHEMNVRQLTPPDSRRKLATLADTCSHKSIFKVIPPYSYLAFTPALCALTAVPVHTLAASPWRRTSAAHPDLSLVDALLDREQHQVAVVWVPVGAEALLEGGALQLGERRQLARRRQLRRHGRQLRRHGRVLAGREARRRRAVAVPLPGAWQGSVGRDTGRQSDAAGQESMM